MPQVIAAPAALKGVLSAPDAAAAVADGFRAAGLAARELPVADGGDGTAEVLAAALGGRWRTSRVSDALGRPVEAPWLLLPDGTAVVESAAAIGIARLAREELDPLRASSRGLGELIRAAERARPRALLVCLGGTATVDGGAGLREVLPLLTHPTTALHDVRTTLDDAARVFGPQKGAGPRVVAELEERLRGCEDLRPYAGLEGSGAAGGLGAALAALGADLVPGAPFVLERIGFRRVIRSARLVVTGEGTVDETTLAGKAPAAVLAACRAANVRCVLFGGVVRERPRGVELHELSGDPARARSDLVDLGEGLARQLGQ